MAVNAHAPAADPAAWADRLAALPRFRLAQLPTPLQRVASLEQALGCPPLYVKRDDLTGFAYGGNKVRTLELLTGAARDRGCDVLVTGGGPTSAHCLTTAAVAQVAGLACVLVCPGDAPVSPPVTQVLARAAGARIRFTGDDDRASVDAGIEQAAAQLCADGRRPFALPRGGATPLGSLAYVDAVTELAAQLAHLDVTADVVVLATGSCGTQAGVLAGTIAVGAPWRVVGVSVSRPVAECVERVTGLATAATRRLGIRPPDAHEVVVIDGRGPGFGHPSPEGRRHAHLAAATAGLVLDDVYTAKALAHLPAVAGGGPVVFWHTGGIVSSITGAVAEARGDAR
ncbi:pyridoxal-phosphate dependent enzyme [soil metagenome]